MDSDELQKKVIAAIAEVGNQSADEITLDSTFEDLGIDSLNGFDLLCNLEDELGVVISDEDARKITTVKDVVDCITPLISAK